MDEEGARFSDVSTMPGADRAQRPQPELHARELDIPSLARICSMPDRPARDFAREVPTRAMPHWTDGLKEDR